MKKNISSIIILLEIFLLLGGFFNSSNFLVQASTIITTIQVRGCGNNIVEDAEECDGSDLDGENCISRGYNSGTLSCTAGCAFNDSNCSMEFPPPPPSGGAGGASGYTPPTPAKVIFKGKAYPQATLNILKYGEIVITFTVDSSGFFEEELTDLLEGTYIFGIWAQDQKDRRSVTITLPVTVLWGMTATINGIFIAPTIETEKTQVDKGEILNISGQTFPQSEVNISIIDSAGKKTARTTNASADGTWSFAFNTSVLEEGRYTLWVQAISPDNLESSFSHILTFYIGEAPPGVLPPEEEIPEEIILTPDLNNDGRVDLVDFSILLYWWENDKFNIDFNQDKIINIIDFSIMMYWWTG